MPHAALPAKVADDETVFDRHPEQAPTWDALCNAGSFDDPAIIQRVAAARRARSGRSPELLKLRCAVRDIIDGLGTLTHRRPMHALMNEFERPLLGRPSLAGALRLPLEWVAEMDAATRLLYVRVALLVLADPPDPTAEVAGGLGGKWLQDLYAHSRPMGWQKLFQHAVRDPLLLFTTQLPREAVLTLNERSLAWPADLRRRWTYATAAGAVAGYVF